MSWIHKRSAQYVQRINVVSLFPQARLFRISSSFRFRRTCTFLLSPPSTLCPRLCSHMPSCALITATLPLVPFTGSTNGPAIVCAPNTLRPLTGFNCRSLDSLTGSSGGTLTMTFLIALGPANVPADCSCGISTTRTCATESFTSVKSPPIPWSPFLNLSLHERR